MPEQAARKLWQEVWRDVQRTLVTLSVVASVTLLAIREVIDAAAVTGLLGAAIGVVGTTSVVAAHNGRNGPNNERGST